MGSTISAVLFGAVCFCTWWLFRVLAKNHLSKTTWLSMTHFSQEYPKKAWVIKSYPFLLIFVIPLSIIFAARYFQTATTSTFFLAVLFIPFITVQFIKGIIEIIFGVSSHIRLRESRKYTISLRVFRTSFSGLEMFEHQFACAQEYVRRVGFIRILVVMGLLSGAIYFIP